MVFSRTLRKVLEWNNSRLAKADLVEEVRSLKTSTDDPLRTIGSLSVVKALLEAGVVDRLRLVVFPQILGGTGREPVFPASRTSTWNRSRPTSSTAACHARVPSRERQPDGLSRSARAFTRGRIRPAGGPATVWDPLRGSLSARARRTGVRSAPTGRLVRRASELY